MNSVPEVIFSVTFTFVCVGGGGGRGSLFDPFFPALLASLLSSKRVPWRLSFKYWGTMRLQSPCWLLGVCGGSFPSLAVLPTLTSSATAVTTETCATLGPSSPPS